VDTLTVDTDGSILLFDGVTANDPHTVSKALPNGSIVSQRVTSMPGSTASNNFSFWRIIPDGQGGVVFLWTNTDNVSGYNLYATHLTFGGSDTSCLLFSNAYSADTPQVVLGESGTAFATEGFARVKSFQMDTCQINWTYTSQTAAVVDILSVTPGGGLAVSDPGTGIISLTSGGSPTQLTAGGAFGQLSYSWTGAWSALFGSGIARVALPELLPDFAST